VNNEQMRIGEFAAAAGVSARTVRYYIVEGLLPPPDGTGMGAMYGPAHLDRFRLILRLKDAYLPLREIRRQLTGLDDDQVRQRLRELDTAATRGRSSRAPTPTPEDTMQTRERADSATDYLRRIARSDDRATPPAAMRSPFEMAGFSPGELNALATSEPQPVPGNPNDPVYPGYAPARSPLTIGRAVPAALPPEPPAHEAEGDDATAAENWVRLRIGDDVELLVRSGAYHRLRDRVDWLLGWARAIFR
jgi:DNA-binding transcriptional MerR regulator